jgi:class 3 adenylate cyclase
MREHERVTRRPCAHGGSEVKTMGDGFEAFGSATKALECAIAIQRAFDVPDTRRGARPCALRPDRSIRVRIGLNAVSPLLRMTGRAW